MPYVPFFYSSWKLAKKIPPEKSYAYPVSVINF